MRDRRNLDVHRRSHIARMLLSSLSRMKWPGLLPGLMICWSLFLPPVLAQSQPAEVHVVVYSTRSQKQARHLARQYVEKGYPAEAYFTASGYYAVTIGKYPRQQARRIRDEARRFGDIGEDAFFSGGSGFVRRIFPPGEDHHYVQVLSTRSREAAVQHARGLEARGYSAGVFWTSTGYYAVVLGPFGEKKAREVKAEAVRYGDAGKDAYLTTGKGFLRQVYPRDREEVFIIANSTPSRTEALELAQRYAQKGYPSEVYATSTRYYAVTLGHYPRAQAEQIRDRAVRRGLIRRDAYLTTGNGFRKRIYPEE